MTYTAKEVMEIITEIKKDINSIKNNIKLKDIDFDKFSKDLIKVNKIIESLEKEVDTNKNELLILKEKLELFIKNNTIQYKEIKESLNQIQNQNHKIFEEQTKQKVYNSIYKIVITLISSSILAVLSFVVSNLNLIDKIKIG